jgi:hypothetical protein
MLALPSRTSKLVLLCGSLLACARGNALSHGYAFTLRAEGDPGEPLAGVRLLNGEQVVATSDADGFAKFTVGGEEGHHVKLSVVCPEGTTVFEKELTTTLRAYADDRVPELLARCAPNERELTVVALFENGAGLPIQHRLKTLAVTDRDGVAHFALRGKPGETFRLLIDTSTQPGLRPANPGASLTIGGREDAQVLERAFILPKPTPRPRPRGAVMPKRI